MGSDVVFDSPYLDRYLRFGWYLDIIMLLLLGDTSLTFGLDSVVDLDDWDYTFDDGWFEVIRFSDLPYIYAILGHISLSVEIFRSSWSHMILTTHGTHDELIVYCYLVVIPRWSLSWAIQLGSHFLAFRYRHASSFERRFLDVWVWFSCGRGWQRSHIWWWIIWCCSIFGLFHIWFHIGTYFHFDWDLQIFMESHDHPHPRDTSWDDDLFVILSWSPSGASLEPSNQTHIFRHLVVIIFFLLGHAFLICGSDSDTDVDD